MEDNLYEVQWWNSSQGRWDTDFTSNDVHQIQNIFNGRQKPLKETFRIRRVEDITRFFDL